MSEITYELEERFTPRPARIDMDALQRGTAELPRIMAAMGFESLRSGQDSTIATIMSGRDALCIMPTGGGKSALFIIPSLALNQRTLVFSPLQALMRDQVTSLQRRLGPNMHMLAPYRDPPVDYMSGQRTDAENAHAARRWMSGELNLLYVAPERLRNPWFIDAIRAIKPTHVAVDEAHCVSQWGHNFRSDYLKIGDFIQEQNPGVVTAFTATAPPPVQADIRRVLGMTEATLEMHWVTRTNLDLISEDYVSDYAMAQQIKEIKGSVVVYFCSKPELHKVANFLSDQLKEEVGIFHADIAPSEKAHQQDMFMNSHTRVMCSTNAFGMGVDKADIRAVIHRHHPGSLEALVQEVGRSGRDGLDALCLTYFSPQAANLQRFMIESGHPPERDVRNLFRVLQMQADSDGVVQMLGNDLAKEADISGKHVSSIIEILKGALVIERTKKEQKLCQIALVGDSGDNRFEALRSALQLLGIREGSADDDYWEVDLVALAQQLEREVGTVRSWLKKWDDAGLIRYEAPYKGALTKIVGSIDTVDFAASEYKAVEAWKGLDQVLRYHQIPDKDKHAYIEHAFFENYGGTQVG